MNKILLNKHHFKKNLIKKLIKIYLKRKSLLMAVVLIKIIKEEKRVQLLIRKNLHRGNQKLKIIRVNLLVKHLKKIIIEDKVHKLKEKIILMVVIKRILLSRKKK